MPLPDVIPGVTVARPAILLRQRVAFAVVLLLPVLAVGVAGLRALHAPPGVSAIVPFLLLYVLAGIGVEVGYHRLFSHRAFSATTPVRVTLAILGTMALQGPASYWVAHHRKHHAYSDGREDPHSPFRFGPGGWARLRGILFSHVGWFFHRERASVGRFARDIVDDPGLAAIDRWYPAFALAGVALPAAIGGALAGSWSGAWEGAIFGGGVRIFVGQHLTFLVSSICHGWGSRPFETADRSGNMLWLAPFTFGASLHNSHHARPGSPDNRLRWWEPDVGAWCIRGLMWLGLAEKRAATEDVDP